MTNSLVSKLFGYLEIGYCDLFGVCILVIGYLTMKKLFYDVKKCLGCRSCEIACALAHSESGDLFKVIKEKEKPLPRKKVLSSRGKNYPVSCTMRSVALVAGCV